MWMSPLPPAFISSSFRVTHQHMKDTFVLLSSKESPRVLGALLGWEQRLDIYFSLSFFAHASWLVDSSSPTRYGTHPLGSEAQSPNYWTTQRISKCISLTINHNIPVPSALSFQPRKAPSFTVSLPSLALITRTDGVENYHAILSTPMRLTLFFNPILQKLKSNF